MTPSVFPFNRWLTWFHRWAGVVLGLFFAAWFASGAVLHFVGFPSLSVDEQQAGSEVIDASRLRLDAQTALASIPGATALRLISVAGQPVYVGNTSSGMAVAISAETGEPLPFLGASTAKTIAQSFARRSAADVDGPFDYDQWVVHQRFDRFRPVYRVRFDDPAETDLYVSARTGEVVQRTRGSERAWNWCGAVVHWIYFTALRKSWNAWNQVVWWLSLTALISSAAGTWLGIVRWSANRSAGRRGISPFRRWMRWHHIIGLFASLVVIAYMLSGWLSMDHGRLFSHGEASDVQVAAMRGLSLAESAALATPVTLSSLMPATEVTLNVIDGHPFLTGYGPAGKAGRVLVLAGSNAAVGRFLPDALLLAGIQRVWPGAGECPVSSRGFDDVYRLAESTGLAAMGFCVGPPGPTRTYVDRLSGNILAVMDTSRRSYAWIYYALHTMQFPGLIEHPFIRTVLVLSFLALGFVLSVTGVVLGVFRLRRSVT